MATAKPEPAKVINNPESSNRLAKLEADLGKLREEIKRTVAPPHSQTAPIATPSNPPPTSQFQRPGLRATNSAGEGPPSQDVRMNGLVRPLMQNIPTQQRQPLLCWDCSLSGHIRRDCPMRNRPMHGPHSGNNATNRELTRKMEDKANVYLRMSVVNLL